MNENKEKNRTIKSIQANSLYDNYKENETDAKKPYLDLGEAVTWNAYEKPIHYKMFMRSTGKAKQGDCIYAPLVTATAIDYITIPMENIFIIKDEDVPAMVNAVSVKTHNVPYGRKVIDWEATEKLINVNNLTFYKKKRRDNPKLKYIRESKSVKSYRHNSTLYLLKC